MRGSGRCAFGVSLGLLTLVACSHDGTGPGAAANVDVAVSVVTLSGPVFVTSPIPNSPTPDSEPAIQCGVALRATATGAGTAKWLDANFLLYAGKDRSKPVDSVAFSAAQIQQSWGGAEIVGGQTRDATWRVTVVVPWALTIAYHYEPAGGGSVKTATVSFTCGPIPPADASPPTITNLAARAPAAGLQPGDTLVVTYAVTGQAGLWESVVQLSGPCDVRRVVAETLQVSVTHTTKIALPIACQLGVPIGVTLLARDAALQQTSRVLATQFSITDRTPPFIYPLLGSWWHDTGGTPVFSRDYFVGDTIYIQLNASDNYAVKTLVWEVWPAGFRDSLAVSGQLVATWIRLPVPPAWVGPIQLRFYARDAVGLTSDTVVTAPDSMRVGATIQRPVVTTTLPVQLLDMQIDAKRGVLYVVPAWGNNLLALSTTTLTVTSVSLPDHPWGIDLSAGGDSLIVTLPAQRALGILDLRQSTPALTLVPVTGLDSTIAQRPVAVQVAANGKAFLPLQGSNASAYTMLEVDLTSGVQRIRTDAGNHGWVGGIALARSFDHSTLVTNGNGPYFERYDALPDAFGPVLTARTSWGPTLDGTGQHIVVGLDLYDANLQFVRQIRSPMNGAVPTRALSPDGVYLFEGLGGIIRARVSDGWLQDRSPAPFTPDLIRLSPDGTLLAMIELVHGWVAVMDLR